ncbi:L-serine dehydratase [Desulfovibrionales bacterium]
MSNNPITTSVFELFRIGPGPSSSHTIGPMAAAADFIARAACLPAAILNRAVHLKVELLGSLSATGHGHGTVRAVAAGLLGHRPAKAAPNVLDSILPHDDSHHHLHLGPHELTIKADDIVLGAVKHNRPFSNTIIFRLLDTENITLLEAECFSTGGGFILWNKMETGIPDAASTQNSCPAPLYPYSTMHELHAQLEITSLTLPQLLLENELALTGKSPQDVFEGLDDIMAVMEDAVERGLAAEDPLPGPLGLRRKAPALFVHYQQKSTGPDADVLSLCACAFAAAEENAAGHTIVTAPTAGSSGVLPACLYVSKNLRPTQHTLRANLREGLLAAAVIGFLARHNASLSGAEIGCQGEIGVASAMAAAMLCQIRGLPVTLVENAAETALEHHLGMTCDPVGGYVQIPCIERNAMGAVKARAATIIAMAEPAHSHLVGLDQAIQAMAETGRDMCSRYKETSLGGLATTLHC